MAQCMGPRPFGSLQERWLLLSHELLTEAPPHHLAAGNPNELPAATSSGQATLQRTGTQPPSGSSAAASAGTAFALNVPQQHSGQDFRSAAVAPPLTKETVLAKEGTDFWPLAPSIPPQAADDRAASAADKTPSSRCSPPLQPQRCHHHATLHILACIRRHKLAALALVVRVRSC